MKEILTKETKSQQMLQKSSNQANVKRLLINLRHEDIQTTAVDVNTSNDSY